MDFSLRIGIVPMALLWHAVANAQAASPRDEAIRANNQGAAYLSRQQYPQAEAKFRAALTGCASCPERPTFLANLGLLYQRLARPGQAEPLLLEALELREAADGPFSQTLLVPLNHLALLYRSQGDARALPFAKRAADLVDETLLSQSPNGARAYSMLGSVLHLQGDLADARKWLRRGVDAAEKLPGPPSIPLAEAIASLAYLDETEGHLDVAEDLYRHALATLLSAGDEAASRLPSLMNNLAQVLRQQHAFDEAEQLFRRSIALYEKQFGRDHADLAAVYANFANQLSALHRFKEAERYLRQAQRVTNAAFPQGHPRVAILMSAQGLLEFERGRYTQAEGLFLKSKAIFQVAYPEGHPELARIESSLGQIYAQQDRWAESAQAFATVLAALEHLHGPRSAVLVEPLRQYAAALAELGESTEADRADARAAGIQTRLNIGASGPGVPEEIEQP